MYAKEITELENRLSHTKAVLFDCSMQLAEKVNQGYGVETPEFKLFSLNVATWANAVHILECDLENAKAMQAKQMHDRHIITIINLSNLAKDINAKANKR